MLEQCKGQVANAVAMLLANSDISCSLPPPSAVAQLRAPSPPRGLPSPPRGPSPNKRASAPRTPDVVRM